MKITFNLSDFFAALDIIGVVQPMVVQNLPASYLFVVSGDKCRLYSRNEMSVASAMFNLISSTGDGQFVYPAAFLGSLKYLDDDEVCTMEATDDEGTNFKVKYSTNSGAESERGTIDPQLLFSTCDEDLAASTSTYEFSSRVLREAINQARPFLADLKDQKVSDNFKCLQIMDATLVDKEKQVDYSKGDGYMFVGDSNRAFFFQCDDFKGKSLEIHGQHLGAFLSFLGKCGDTVTIHKGGHFTFAVSPTGMLGWVRPAKLHDKFNYFSLKHDQVVLKLNKSRVLNSLQHTRSELEKDETKIKFHFEVDQKLVWFTFDGAKAKSKSIPVPVNVKEVSESFSGFLLGGNINHLISLFDLAKGNEIEFRNRIFPADASRKHDVGLLRSIDEFNLDSAGKITPESEGNFKCRVTRFMPSKD
jgi:hypothetical protein